MPGPRSAASLAGSQMHGSHEVFCGIPGASECPYGQRPCAVPQAVAVRLLLTGDPIGADVALQYGMLDAVSEPGRAVTDALTLAARIAANSPAAVRAIHAATAELASQGWLATDRAVAEAETSPDHNEGIDAFFEKRAARWSPLP